ncbi:MAG: class I SAM-dependent methyltransferase [Devosia indica]
MRDGQTLRFYADNAAAYARHRTRPCGDQLDAFLAALPKGARILELGCGNGMDAAHMRTQGFDVDATDGTPAWVAEAQKRVGGAARLMLFDELEAEAGYDGVWACASLLHVVAASLPDILSRVRRALRPDGVFVASFKAGTGEGRDPYGRYYNYPSAKQLDGAYRAAGWSDFTLETNMGSGFDALPTVWLWVTARR